MNNDFLANASSPHSLFNKFFLLNFASLHTCIFMSWTDEIFVFCFLQFGYDEWLAAQCGCPGFEEWRKQMYVAALENLHKQPETYRDELEDHHLVLQAHQDFTNYTVNGVGVVDKWYQNSVLPRSSWNMRKQTMKPWPVAVPQKVQITNVCNLVMLLAFKSNHNHTDLRRSLNWIRVLGNVQRYLGIVL